MCVCVLATWGKNDYDMTEIRHDREDGGTGGKDEDEEEEQKQQQITKGLAEEK